MPTIRDAKILIMATDGFEQSELMTPLNRLKQAGASVLITAPNGPRIKGWKGSDWGETVAVDLLIEAVVPADFHCLILPGGQMNPDALRTNAAAIKLILDFLSMGKIVAAICHAPWLLAEAKALEGRELTSWRSIKTDMVNAGGLWVDKPVVVDDGMITSRAPEDLDAFVAKIIEEIETHEHLEGEPFRQSA